MASRRGFPDVLYHYTDLEGLFGILRSRTIYATSIHCLNDSEEFRYGLARLVGAAEAVFPTGSPLEAVARQIRASCDDRNLSSLFVASLSAHHDQLSQWRAYTPKGGYSVGFDGRALARSARRFRFSLRPCIYDPREQEGLFRALLGRLKDSYERDGYGLLEARPAFAVDAFSRSLRLLQLVKHPSFAEEAEWRLVSRPLPSAGPHIRWRARGPIPVPYLEIPLAKSREPLPLTRIVVGPMPNQELSALLLHDAVFTLGGLRSVEITTSETPYRSL